MTEPYSFVKLTAVESTRTVPSTISSENFILFMNEMTEYFEMASIGKCDELENIHQNGN